MKSLVPEACFVASIDHRAFVRLETFGRDEILELAERLRKRFSAIDWPQVRIVVTEANDTASLWVDRRVFDQRMREYATGFIDAMTYSSCCRS